MEENKASSHLPSLSLYLHSFFVFLSQFLAPCSFSPLLSIFLTRCVFPSVSLHQALSFLPSFYSLSVSLSLFQAVLHILRHHSCLLGSLSFLSSFMLIACSASLPKSICPSSAVSLSLYISLYAVSSFSQARLTPFSMFLFISLTGSFAPSLLSWL